MRIICTCGIEYQIYDYPPTEVEIEGKKAIQRHVICPCDREYVIHTQPKYEPAAANTEDAENTSGVVSFDELVRRLSKGAEAPTPTSPTPDWSGWGSQPTTPPPPPKAPKKASVPTPSLPSVIVDPNAVSAVTSDEKSIYLSQDDADVVGSLIANYGTKFKDAEAQKEEVQEFADLAARAKQEGMLILSDKEQRMARMGFLERNVKSLWPVKEYDDEADFNVQQTAKAKFLREKFKQVCGWDK